VVEIAQVEHLQVDPFGADLGEFGYPGRDLTRRAADAVLAEGVRLPADRGGPAAEFGVVLAAAHRLGHRVGQGFRIAPGRLAGLADAGKRGC
jgi:hypothetical protein